MNAPAPVEAVVFDWGGTLTPWHRIDLLDQWLAYAEVYEPTRREVLAGQLLAAEQEVWRRAREQHRSAALSEVIRAAGLDPHGTRHEQALGAYQAYWEPHTYADPDAAPLFAGLREKGVRVGVLSNTLWSRDYHTRVFARDGLGELIDAAVYSSEIAWTKPHPEAFRSAAAAVGASDPSRCVFVGDRPFEDIHGAQQVGMRAILVPHSEIPADQRGHTEGQPDAVALRLADVLDVVEAWSAAAG